MTLRFGATLASVLTLGAGLGTWLWGLGVAGATWPTLLAAASLAAGVASLVASPRWPSIPASIGLAFCVPLTVAAPVQEEASVWAALLLALGWEGLDLQRRIRLRLASEPRSGDWVGSLVLLHARRSLILAGLGTLAVWLLGWSVRAWTAGSAPARFSDSLEAGGFPLQWTAAGLLVLVLLALGFVWPSSLRPLRGREAAPAGASREYRPVEARIGIELGPRGTASPMDEGRRGLDAHQEPNAGLEDPF